LKHATSLHPFYPPHFGLKELIFGIEQPEIREVWQGAALPPFWLVGERIRRAHNLPSAIKLEQEKRKEKVKVIGVVGDQWKALPEPSLVQTYKRVYRFNTNTRSKNE
jgi:hypothetical protein